MIEHKPECTFPESHILLTRIDEEGMPQVSCVTCGSTKLSEYLLKSPTFMYKPPTLFVYDDPIK
jgi:hypothetical protein